jgi:chemotaxis protein methyltransferase CheR
MTTNETSWFRDMHPFNALTTEILPDLAKRKQTNIRIWSAACSTGQEPYSISISIHEYLKKNPGALNKRVEIIATDLSPSVLEQAKSGRYEEIATSRGLSAERRDRFFIRKEDHWEVRPEISERIVFKAVNLMQNFSGFGKFDVIFCRNVLIYFSTNLKKDVLARMAAALNPDGYLILGGSESMANYSDAFHMVRTSNTVVYKLKPR